MLLDRIIYFFRRPLQFPIVLITKLPFFRFIHKTFEYQNKITFEFWFKQKILNLGGNKKAYWPVHPTSSVFDVEKILIGIDAYPGLMKGCYITGRGGLTIGDYTQIAPNVVIVTANHDIYDTRKHICSPVSIGKYCWIGASAKIMPGVILGDFTIVGAGTVVTKSFSEGYCLIAGIPAKKIKDLDANKCVKYEYSHKYYGYLNEVQFQKWKTKNYKL